MRIPVIYNYCEYTLNGFLPILPTLGSSIVIDVNSDEVIFKVDNIRFQNNSDKIIIYINSQFKGLYNIIKYHNDWEDKF